MKRLLPVIALIASSLVAYGQKVDLDEFKIAVSYVQVPKNPLPIELTTYSTEFTAVGFNLSQLGYSIDNLRSTYFTLSGFRKLEKGGHFTIKVQIDLPRVEDIKEVTRVETKKEKDGKETKVNLYANTFRYYVPMRYVVTDYRQNTIEEGAITDGNNAHPFTTDYFASQALLLDYWKRNREALLTERTREFMGQSLSAFQGRLNNNYGYVPRSQQPAVLWILNSSKHPEFDNYQRNYQVIKSAFDRMTPETGLDLAALKPAMDYLAGLPANYPADEKTDRKLRYSAYYNLGWIYYWLDDMDNALSNADLLIKNEYDKRDGDALKESINATKTRLVANRMTSRHLKRDLSNAIPPAEPAELVAQREAEAQALKDEQREKMLGQLNTVKQKIDELAELYKKRAEQQQLAIRQIDTLLVKQPQNDQLYQKRGLLKQAVGDGAGAVADLEKAVSLKPQSLPYLNDLSRVALWAGAYTTCIEVSERALALAPKDGNLMLQKGMALVRATRYAESVTAFDQAARMMPKNVDPLNERGYAHDYLAQYDAALDDFNKALQLNPKNAEARFGIAFVKTNMGRYNDALTDYAEAQKLNANDYRINGNRAFALGNLNRMDEANKDIDQALSRNNRYSNGYFVRAWLRAKEKNYQGALEDARKAIANGHTKAYKSYTIAGDALLGMSIPSEALKMYDEALRLQPAYADAVTGKQKAAQLNTK